MDHVHAPKTGCCIANSIIKVFRSGSGLIDGCFRKELFSLDFVPGFRVDHRTLTNRPAWLLPTRKSGDADGKSTAFRSATSSRGSLSAAWAKKTIFFKWFQRASSFSGCPRVPVVAGTPIGGPQTSRLIATL
jgi:hypothetical protein